LKKLTDEQLSRVISAHAAGMLGQPGWNANHTACLYQAAEATYGGSGTYDDLPSHWAEAAKSFDASVGLADTWNGDVDDLLEWMEGVGLA